MSGELPPALAREVQGLQAAEWRERKQAVDALKALLPAAEPAVLALLVEHLLDGVLSPVHVDGRAACHEVLVAIGAKALPNVMDRLGRQGTSRRFLVDLLGEIGDESHVPLLRRILTEPESDANLQASAATALGRLGGEAARAALIELLRSASQMLRVYALDALRLARAAVPVADLEPLVADRFTRKAAAALLAYSREAAALPVLVSLLSDGMAGVRATAVRALMVLDEDLRQIGKEGLVAAGLRRADASVRKNLRELIEHKEREVRQAAIRAAGMAGDAEAVGVVLQVMDDPLIQEQALVMIGQLGASASDALLAAARAAGGSRHEHVLRLAGALTYGTVGAELLALLCEGLEEPNEDAACEAAESLSAVGDRTCLRPLYEAMRSDGRLGETAADAVASVLERSAEGRDDLDLVVGATWPQEGALARNLCRVVGRLGTHRYAPHLVSMLGSADVGVRVAAAQALGSLRGEHEGISALTFALTDEEPQVRAAACRSLGQLQAPQAYASLVSATADRSPLVRTAAVQALVALDNPIALARFRAIVAEDPVPTVVVHAIAGLGSSGLDQDLTMLMSLCTSEDREVVKAAARALANFRAHRATAALLGLLAHERWDVRWTAAEVLAAREDPTALRPLERVLATEPDESVRQVLAQAVERLAAVERSR